MPGPDGDEPDRGLSSMSRAGKARKGKGKEHETESAGHDLSQFGIGKQLKTRAGIANKFSTDIRGMILQSLHELGGVEYLVKQGRKRNPAPYLSLINRIIPRDIRAEVQGQMLMSVISGVPGQRPIYIEHDRTQPIANQSQHASAPSQEQPGNTGPGSGAVTDTNTPLPPLTSPPAPLTHSTATPTPEQARTHPDART